MVTQRLGSPTWAARGIICGNSEEHSIGTLSIGIRANSKDAHPYLGSHRNTIEMPSVGSVPWGVITPLVIIFSAGENPNIALPVWGIAKSRDGGGQTNKKIKRSKKCQGPPGTS